MHGWLAGCRLEPPDDPGFLMGLETFEQYGC
jgi:hypothetical protein